MGALGQPAGSVLAVCDVVRRGVANIAQHQSRLDRDEIEARIERAFDEGVDKVLKKRATALKFCTQPF